MHSLETLDTAVVTGIVNFIQRDDLYKREKPYIMNYAPEDNFPRSNIHHQLVDNLQIEDIRNNHDEFTLQKNGLTIMNVKSEMAAEDYDFPDKVEKRCLPKIAEAMKTRLGARSVQVYEYVVGSFAGECLRYQLTEYLR